MRGWPTNGIAGVGAESDGAEAGGHSGRCASARPGRNAIECIRIVRVPRQDRTHGFVRRERPLGQVRLRQHDRPGILDLSHHGGILQRRPSFERQRSTGGLHADGLEVVFHDGRNAVQRARRAAGRVALVERVGNGQRLRIREHDRVDRGATLVERVDPIEVRLRERATSQRLRLESGVNLGDGRFFDAKRPTGGLGGGGVQSHGRCRGKQQDSGELGVSDHSPKVHVPRRGDRQQPQLRKATAGKRS